MPLNNETKPTKPITSLFVLHDYSFTTLREHVLILKSKLKKKKEWNKVEWMYIDYC